MKEICICAAVKTIDGRIARGHRHTDCYQVIFKEFESFTKAEDIDGFMTSENRFVDRFEGARLQREAGVVSVKTGKEVGARLSSDDLY